MSAASSNKYDKYDVVAYVDGCYKDSLNLGGWGVRIESKGNSNEFYGGEKGTASCNRMELLAAIKAIEQTPFNATLAICSDSVYVVEGVKAWLPTWQRNWLNADRVPAKNSDLWQQIKKHVKSGRKISWHWVKGHADCPGNIRADALASRGARIFEECREEVISTA